MKKLFKKTKKRRVLSEERQLPKQNQSILNHINMIKDQEYEQFVQKIGNKVNTAKNFKMYGLQSNRRLILKITQGRIDRFPECNDSSINKVFSWKSFNSSNLNSTNDSSQPRRRLSNEKCDFASDWFAKTISRNWFSPDSRATYNRDMMSL